MSERPPQAKRILVVDDDEASCTFFEMLLCKEGYEVRTIFNGASALAALKSEAVEKFDLVLLDLMLPGLGGAEILEELKKPEYHCSAVIIVTARSLDASALQKLKTIPFVKSVFLKPVDFLEFKQKVREAVS